MAKPRKIKDKIIKLRQSGMTYNAIAKELGCSKGSVSYACKKVGINPGTSNFLHLKNEMIKLREQGKTLLEITNLLNCSLTSVKKYCSGIKRPNIERLCITCEIKLTNDNCYFKPNGTMCNLTAKNAILNLDVSLLKKQKDY